MTKNKQEILRKAEKIYQIVTGAGKSKMAKLYKELSCDFKILEGKCTEYRSEKES